MSNYLILVEVILTIKMGNYSFSLATYICELCNWEIIFPSTVVDRCPQCPLQCFATKNSFLEIITASNIGIVSAKFLRQYKQILKQKNVK